MTAPLRETQEPVVRPYSLVGDLEAAVTAAVEARGELALPPMEIPGHGTFAIYILCGTEHGLWQRERRKDREDRRGPGRSPRPPGAAPSLSTEITTMAIRLPDPTRQELLASIQRYFIEERGEEIGDLQATFFLDFVLREVGPSIYNQAIRRAGAPAEDARRARRHAL